MAPFQLHNKIISPCMFCGANVAPIPQVWAFAMLLLLTVGTYEV